MNIRTTLKFSAALLIMLGSLTETGAQQRKQDRQTKHQPSKKNRNSQSATVYTTAKATDLRLKETGKLSFGDFVQPMETESFVLVDPQNSFQSFVGIGGAITDASAETFAKLPEAKRDELLKAYFDKENGIGYSLLRTNINSCDFSSGSYTYVQENDAELKTFSIAHDEEFKMPMIKAAIAIGGGDIPLYVSPWSPPAWMKSNGNMLQGGKLLDQYRQSWANYYVKFIKAYEAGGIPVWGLTVQNEPMAKQTWESCIYTAEEERDFIKNYLGPTLAKNGLGKKKLIAWDHNRDLIYQRASTILNDPQAAKYVWGIGFHWYETWTGGPMLFENLKRVHESFPGKNLVFTEGCHEKYSAERLDDWVLGEKYGYSMINDFNSGTVAWTDWNILLDEKGGPNHVGNFCFAPVHAMTQSGELVYTNAYYYIGHFSKFLKPGAKRIATTGNRAQLETTAFRNPDGKIVVIVMNRTGDKMKYRLAIADKAAEVESLPNSIATYIVE